MGKLPRLAPLEHVRNLYADAAATLPPGRNRKIFEKKDLIQAIRAMSPVKALAKSMSATAVSALSTPVADGPDMGSRALTELEAAVNVNARRYNDLKQLADKRQEQLKVLMDDLHVLQVENDALGKMASKQTAESLRIEGLRDEIERIVAAMEDKDFQHRQLEHMSERLRRNHITFDAHIKSMEDALRASKKELADVTSYLRQLEISKEDAMGDTRALQAKLVADRRAREKELAEKQAEVDAARKMEEWRLQRETVRQEMAAEMRGDLSADQETRLHAALVEKESSNDSLKAASRERSERAAALEEAFLAIRQATGVTSVELMVDKFLSQDTNQKSLEDEQAEAEARLAKVKKAKEDAEASFRSMKACGLGGVELNREMFSKLEDEISEARAGLKLSKASCERLEGVLVAVRQGAVGLSQRLLPFASLLGQDDDADADAAAGAPEASDTLSLLLSCEKKLSIVLEIVGKAAPNVAAASTADESSFFLTSTPALHSNNVRVAPSRAPLQPKSRARIPVAAPSDESSSEEEGEDEEEGDGQGDRRDVFDRKSLKKKALSKQREEIMKREKEARRAVMAAKIATDLKKKETMERLTSLQFEATGMTFLTQKPDLM